MCIRDSRIDIVNTLGSGLYFILTDRLAGSDDLAIDVGQAPVSYTHLDVYKRQGLHGAVFLNTRAACTVALLLTYIISHLFGN